MEKKRNDNEEMEIDLLELLMVMKKHLAAILLAGIVGLVIMFACTTILMTPLYSASSMMYVMPDNSNSNSSRAKVSIWVESVLCTGRLC